MRETEKIWMNGELVDWADARSTSARTASTTARGLRGHPLLRDAARAGRLPADRPHQAAPQLGTAALHGAALHVEELPAATHELIGANGLPECYVRPIAFYGYGDLGVSTARQPGRRRDHELALGRVPRRGGAAERDPREDLVLEAGRAEHDPACGQGDRRLPQLDARGHRGEPRGLRRGDPAHRRRLHRRRLRRERVRRQGRHASPRRRSRRRSCRASRARRSSRSRRTSATRRGAQLIRTDLYLADEIFMCGTAAEVTPVRSVDDHEIGPPGPVTKTIQPTLPRRSSAAATSAGRTGWSTPRRTRARAA